MTGEKIALCFKCKHLRRPGDRGYACKAFPRGIPEKILDEGFDHKQPFPEDNGVRFEYDPIIEKLYKE